MSTPAPNLSRLSAMRPALLALALLLVACSDDATTVDLPDETTTSVDLSEPEPLPLVPSTLAPPTTLPPTTAAPATAPPVTRAVVATTRATLPPQTSPPPTQVARTYYANCSEARDAGAAPVRRGDPGYGSHLDRDGDGVGCES